MQTKKEVVAVAREKYKRAGKVQKSKIIDNLVASIGYDRKYAIKILNQTPSKNLACKKAGKPVYYDRKVTEALEFIWNASNQICSKRIVPFIPDFIKSLEKYGYLSLDDKTRQKLLTVSTSTFDRIIKPARIKAGKRLSLTKSGGLLKTQIKVRTFADWNEVEPGFFEGDLVAHCGETAEGYFLNTLVITDIVTTWTECIPLLKKSAQNLIFGLKNAKEILPFKILGFDSDNGAEFINYALVKYCEENNITFTRARSRKKNDQAHVESKNGSIVRRIIGYDRFEGQEAFDVLSELYSMLRLYINFFQPSLKLNTKTRKESKVIKKYDIAKTPYQRIMLSPYVSNEIKDDLTKQFKSLNPIRLQDSIREKQKELWSLASNSADELKDDNYLFYKRSHKKRKKVVNRNWSTRKDAFAEVKNNIRSELEFNPYIKSKELLEKLMIEFPHLNFKESYLRTLQRRMKEVRQNSKVVIVKGYNDIVETIQ